MLEKTLGFEELGGEETAVGLRNQGFEDRVFGKLYYLENKDLLRKLKEYWDVYGGKLL